jgi:hypothetical protein
MKLLALSLLVCALGAETWPRLPDDQLTPGAVLTRSRAHVCVANYSNTVRHTGRKLKDLVYEEYRIAVHVVGEAEIDHRVPLSLGGADVRENLWPQSYLIRPYGAHEKDSLEDRIHALVCHQHSLTLAEGQRVFLGNWIDAYQKYVKGKP